MNGTHGNEEDDGGTTTQGGEACVENGVSCANNGCTTSRQNSNISVDSCSNGERSNFTSLPSAHAAGEQLHVQVEQLTPANCPISKYGGFFFMWDALDV